MFQPENHYLLSTIRKIPSFLRKDLKTLLSFERLDHRRPKACVSQTDHPLSDDNWVVKVAVSCGWSNHEMVEYRIMRGGKKAKSRITTHSFRREDLGLFRDLLGKIP